jgi:hypothetical protein
MVSARHCEGVGHHMSPEHLKNHDYYMQIHYVQILGEPTILSQEKRW